MKSFLILQLFLWCKTGETLYKTKFLIVIFFYNSNTIYFFCEFEKEVELAKHINKKIKPFIYKKYFDKNNEIKM